MGWQRAAVAIRPGNPAKIDHAMEATPLRNESGYYPCVSTPDDRQREAELAEAKEFTKRLRTSEEAGWRDVRKSLALERVDPNDAAVATIFPDDTNLVFGVLLTRDDRCFFFSFEYHADTPWELLEWGSVPPRQRRSYESSLPYAREILDRASEE